MTTKNPVSAFLEQMGSGTASGAAIGGVGALLLTLFKGRNADGERPGILSSLFAITAGALVGGLAGGYIKKDGPLFSPADKGAPAPDGSPVVIRQLGLDKPAGADKVVELDYYSTFKDLVQQAPGFDAAKMKEVDGKLKDASQNFRILLKTGAENATTATFTGAIIPGQEQVTLFNKPVELPIKDGKVDYALAGVLSSMRVAEKNKVAGYIKLPDLKELERTYGSALDKEQTEHLRGELMMSTLAATGKVDKVFAEDIIQNAVKADGTLNMDYLQRNQTMLGIDQKRAVTFAPDGDNLNLGLGTLSADESKVKVEQTVIIDVRKMGGQLRSGQLKQLVDTMVSPNQSVMKGGLDLNMMGSLSLFRDGGITYRKPPTPVEISTLTPSSALHFNQKPAGILNIDEYNGAVRRINQSAAEPSAAPATSRPAAPALAAGAYKPYEITYAQEKVKLDATRKVELDFTSGLKLRATMSGDNKQYVVDDMQQPGEAWKKPGAPVTFAIAGDGSINLTGHIRHTSNSTVLLADADEDAFASKVLAKIPTTMEVTRDRDSGGWSRAREPDQFVIEDSKGKKLVVKGQIVLMGDTPTFMAQELSDSTTPPTLVPEVDGTGTRFSGSRMEPPVDETSYAIPPMVFALEGSTGSDRFKVKDSESTKALALFETFKSKDRVARNPDFEITKSETLPGGDIRITVKGKPANSDWNDAEILLTGKPDASGKTIALRELTIIQGGFIDSYPQENKVLRTGGNTSKGVDLLTDNTMTDIRGLIGQPVSTSGDPANRGATSKRPERSL